MKINALKVEIMLAEQGITKAALAVKCGMQSKCKGRGQGEHDNSGIDYQIQNAFKPPKD